MRALLALLLLAGPALAQDRPTVERTVLDGRLVVDVPAALTVPSAAQLRAKFGAAVPLEAFADSILAVTVSTSALAVPSTAADLPDVLDAYRQQLSAAYPAIEWLRAEVTADGTGVVLDFRTPAGAGRVRNVMRLVPLGDRLGIVAFSASSAAEPAWAAAGVALIEAVRLAD